MHIDKKGYLVISKQKFHGMELIGINKKYKVNKEGLFEEVKEKETYTPIETLGLTPRTLNALINGDILSIESLKSKTTEELDNLKGFGKKARIELKDYL